MIKRFAPLLLVPAIVSAEPGAEPGAEPVADGFTRPLWIDAPEGFEDHLWIVEQPGVIHVLDRESGERRETFLDIRDRVRRENNEEGLLGLAFPEDFAETGRFYVNYTGNDEFSRVVRFEADGPGRLEADPDSAEELLKYEQPYGNHNGGWLDFGPDGLLYVGTGDGGAAFDPKKNGQDLDTLLGKMLRIDVSTESGYAIPDGNPYADGDGACPEIWAYGLRNPWRCSFDLETGDFWIGDVGQNRWEEIDYLPAGEGAGANFGWLPREGFHATPQAGGPRPDGAVDPVYEYDHGEGDFEGRSVTGGYVYRGPVEALRGRYLFADYNNQRVWSFVLGDDARAEDVRDHTDAFAGGSESGVGQITSFGQLPDGEVYYATFDGRIMRVADR